MELTYERCGDYLIPNLIPNREPEGELRKFGRMRRQYLKEHRSGIYSGLLLTEQLKAADQMLWVRKMNGIRARVEEVVREEIIYTL